MIVGKGGSLVRTYLVGVVFLIVLLVSLLSFFWVRDELSCFKTESEIGRKLYLESQENMLMKEVEGVVDYVNYMRSQAEIRLKEKIKSRTYEAWNTATHIYERRKGNASPEKMKEMIHDALYAVSWDDGQGYYFAEDMQGTELVNRNNPELEGTSLMELQDSKGVYIMREILAVAKTKGEGFCSYHWNKPGSPGTLVPKISYVKYFEPLDWVIGTGRYLSDEKEEIKAEAISRIERIRFANERYIFVGDWEGVSLVGPSKNKNMRHVEDPNGVRVVEELIAKSKSGGGFVRYVMPKLAGQRPAPKISYAMGIDDWRWYVGSGIYVDEIERVIEKNQVAMNGRIEAFFVRVGIYISIVLALACVMIYLISKRVDDNVKTFSHFFARAATETVEIDESRLHYDEFRQLAIAANEMVVEHQKAHSDLAESEQRFFQVLEAAHIPMLISNPDEGIEFVNEKFTETFGYTMQEIATGEKWWRLAFPDELERRRVKKGWGRGVKAALRHGKPFTKQIWRLTCKDGTVKDIEYDFTPIGSRSLSIITDITDRKRAERETARLEHMLVCAQKMEAIGLMAGGVAHDLNNILSGIASYPEVLLMMLPDDSPLVEHIKQIQASGWRAAEVVADLLTVARGVASTKSAANLNGIIAEYLESPECTAIYNRHDDVRISRNLAPDLFNISCSTIHVKKCLINLVVNAAEAIGDVGEIFISTRNQYVDAPISHNHLMERGEYAVLSVKDNGPGIADADMDRIFEPFYTKKVMGMSGTGLGLAVVWNTMQDHAGGILVESDGDGTTFELFFPITRELESDTPQDVGLDEIRGDGETILVIDDEPQQRTIASQLLSALGYVVNTVASGEEAIDYLTEETADLLLLDMIMDSGINGHHTFEKILKRNPRQRAVIASGFSETVEIEKTLALGAASFISKPYTMNQLGTVVKAALDGDE